MSKQNQELSGIVSSQFAPLIENASTQITEAIDRSKLDFMYGVLWGAAGATILFIAAEKLGEKKK